MLGLSQAVGLLIAISGAIIVLVTFAFLASRGPSRRGADIPRAMRPGPSDPELETGRLHKLQGWGVILTVFLVIWIPLTWLQEPSQNLTQEEDLLRQSIRRGSQAVQLYSEENQGGIGCVRCHGAELAGSQILNTSVDPPTVVNTPSLTTVCGGPWTGHPLIYSLDDVYTTIRQGRNLMPSWSIRYAGALDDQQINDIVNYVVSIQDESVVTKDHNVCTNPDATQAAIDEFGPPTAPPTTNAPP